MRQVSFRDDIMPLSDPLYRMALRMQLPQQEAEDVVQETMLRLWQRRQQWDEMENIEAFAMTICRNLCLDVLRRYARRAETDAATITSMPDTAHSASPERVAESNDRIEQVRQLIAALPEKQRTCMTLRDLEGKSYRDIADILDITEDQVKVNIFRARQTVKRMFSTIE